MNDNRGYQVLILTNKNQLNILNDGRDTRISGTSKSTMDLTIAFPSLQAILSCNVSDRPLKFSHCVITVCVQSKKSEPQTTVANFNINKANWHLFTSNYAWRQVTNRDQSQTVEALAEVFEKQIYISSTSTTPLIEKKNTSPMPGGEVNYKN